MIAGRPLRFLAAILAGWAATRAVWLWADDGRVTPRAETAGATDDALAAYRAFRRRHPLEPPLLDFARSGTGDTAPWAAVPPRARRAAPPFAQDPRIRVAAAPYAPAPPAPAPVVVTRPPVAEAVAIPRAAQLPPPPAASASRWGGTGWAILRDGGGGRDFAGGRLGAAQAGARLTYALGAERRLAIAARVSSPIEGRGREAALGIEWRPTRLPIRVLAEQRFGLDRGVRGGPAVSLIGGVAALPVAAGFRLDGYGQAGVARLGAFADGGARLARPVATVAGLRLDLGIGAWGGAQPGAARLDLGPGAALAIPLADRSLRIGLDWRQRVAGRVAPGSGLALTIGSDF